MRILQNIATTLAAYLFMTYLPCSAQDKHVDAQQFMQAKCFACHSNTHGLVDWQRFASSEGPDLSFSGSKYQAEWLEQWLQHPVSIRPGGYLPFKVTVSTPTGDKIDNTRVPAHVALSPEEAKAVVSYLETLTREASPYPQPSATNEVRAEVYFRKLLPCAGCHSAAGKGGGLSGPELDDVGKRLKPEWISAYIADPSAWQRTAMPKTALSGDQIDAITKYLLAAPAKETARQSSGSVTGTPISKPASRAEAIYQVLCTQCHGITGNGKGINAPYLFVSPRDHTSFDEMSALTDDRITASIKYGGTAVGKSALMPSWAGVLSDSDVQLLVQYLRQISGTQAKNNTEREQYGQ